MKLIRSVDVVDIGRLRSLSLMALIRSSGEALSRPSGESLSLSLTVQFSHDWIIDTFQLSFLGLQFLQRSRGVASQPLLGGIDCIEDGGFVAFGNFVL